MNPFQYEKILIMGYISSKENMVVCFQNYVEHYFREPNKH